MNCQNCGAPNEGITNCSFCGSLSEIPNNKEENQVDLGKQRVKVDYSAVLREEDELAKRMEMCKGGIPKGWAQEKPDEIFKLINDLVPLEETVFWFKYHHMGGAGFWLLLTY